MDRNKESYIHPSSYVDEGAILGYGNNIWHFSHIMANAKIGDYCNIGQNVFIASNVIIGSNVKVQNNVSIYEGVICEDDVFLGPSMVFTNVYNPRSAVNRKHEYRQTIVKTGASIGANATIICGITIGYYAFVGAGSLVRKDVPDYGLIVGVPGKQIGWMSEHGGRLIFDESAKAICSVSGEEYQLLNNKVSKCINT